MNSTTAAFCPKATSVTKPKPSTLGKGTSYQATEILRKKMASFGAHKPFFPSATEAANLKVSIKQGFYLETHCPHSPLYTWKPPCYKPWLSLSPVWPCTAVWAYGQVHLTQNYPQLLLMGRLITDANLGRASGSWQTEAARPTNILPSDVLPPLVHSNTPATAVWRMACSLHLSLHHTAVKISAFPGILLGMKLNIVERVLLIIWWFWRQINYFKALKKGWREGKSGSLQSFGEIWGIWLKDLDSLQYRCLLGCSMEC